MPSPIPKPISLISASVAVLVTILGVYWSLRNDSTTPLPQFIPVWLLQWNDNHGVIRNIPAYFILAFLWFIAGRNWQQRMTFGFVLTAFGGLTEVIQIWIPNRFASFLDALCSWIGITLAWALCRLMRRALWSCRERQVRLRLAQVEAKGSNELL